MRIASRPRTFSPVNGDRPPRPGPDPRRHRPTAAEPSQVIRRDPNYRPPPAWPPNPPTPPRRPPPPPPPPPPPRYRPPSPRCAPTTAAAAAAAPKRKRRLRRVRPRARSGVRPCRRRRRRHRILDRHQAAPHPGAGRLRRPARRGQGHHVAAGRLGQQAGTHRRNSRPNWPPAATSAMAVPTPSCWCTSPPSGRARRRPWCPFPAIRTWRSPTTARTRSTRRSSFGGAPLLAQTVEQATGMRLDHYAEIGFDGFAVMVDAVGGVTMCPAGADLRPARGHRPARRLPEARRPQRARLRPHPRDAARRPRPDGQPASVHVGPAAPRGQPHRRAQPTALVPDGARGRRCADRRLGRPRLGSRPAGVGAARRHHHDDRADRRIHRQRLGFGRGVGRGRRRPVVRRAEVGRTRAAGRARRRSHPASRGPAPVSPFCSQSLVRPG